MSKLEANLTLLSVTFFWGVQYIFLGNIPDDISTFAFLALTNGIGFLILTAVFFDELRKLTRKIVRNGLLLAMLLFGTNMLITAGSRSLDASTASFFAAANIVFVPIFMRFFGKKASVSNLVGVAIVLLGLLLATGARLDGMGNGVLIIAAADVLSAAYIVVLGQIIGSVNPILTSLCQMFFGTLFGLAGWLIFQPETLLSLPHDMRFWSSVLVIAVFVRGFTTVMQVYAQRYVSALNASLLFSFEIVFTLLTSMFLPAMLGSEPETITPFKLAGCVLILLGVLTSDGAILQWRKKEAAHEAQK